MSLHIESAVLDPKSCTTQCPPAATPVLSPWSLPVYSLWACPHKRHNTDSSLWRVTCARDSLRPFALPSHHLTQFPEQTCDDRTMSKASLGHSFLSCQMAKNLVWSDKVGFPSYNSTKPHYNRTLKQTRESSCHFLSQIVEICKTCKTMPLCWVFCFGK